MIATRSRWRSGEKHQYTLVGEHPRSPSAWTRKHSLLALVLVAFAGIVFFTISSRPAPSIKACDTINHGFTCQPEISHYWGQYSPYFSVPSDIPDAVPSDCNITFAQILSRHGARDPTADKSARYKAVADKIRANVRHFKGKYAFLADYEYDLGADQLNVFGQRQLFNSGIKFYQRYQELSRDAVPLIRASGQKRVVDSAVNWTQGFKEAYATEHDGRHPQLQVDVIISEDTGMNNTLHHDLCTAFESGFASGISSSACEKWAHVFATDIQTRVNRDLIGANLSVQETLYLMDLCPFGTVASPTGIISPFCHLFTEAEWHAYNYYESLDKWYGYGHGNPLGPTQGVGFVNELVARLTGHAVRDHTCTNRTLDSNPKTFPLDRSLYADFSHDNDMVAIVSALGLYADVVQLPNDTVVEAPAAGGFSAAWTAPFASRVYVEKMVCESSEEEVVRVLVNDRVMPLEQCGGDSLGRCGLTAFVDSLRFAREGGRWEECFV